MAVWANGWWGGHDCPCFSLLLFIDDGQNIGAPAFRPLSVIVFADVVNLSFRGMKMDAEGDNHWISFLVQLRVVESWGITSGEFVIPQS